MDHQEQGPGERSYQDQIRDAKAEYEQTLQEMRRPHHDPEREFAVPAIVSEALSLKRDRIELDEPQDAAAAARQERQLAYLESVEKAVGLWDTARHTERGATMSFRQFVEAGQSGDDTSTPLVDAANWLATDYFSDVTTTLAERKLRERHARHEGGGPT